MAFVRANVLDVKVLIMVIPVLVLEVVQAIVVGVTENAGVLLVVMAIVVRNVKIMLGQRGVHH